MAPVQELQANEMDAVDRANFAIQTGLDPVCRALAAAHGDQAVVSALLSLAIQRGVQAGMRAQVEATLCGILVRLGDIEAAFPPTRAEGTA